MNDHIIKITVQKEWSGVTVQDLFRHIFFAPKKLVHEMRMNQYVYLNGSPANWLDILQVGDQLSIYCKKEKIEDGFAYPFPLQVLYDDDHILIVNKPANMTTHPNNNETNTLINAVANYLLQKGVEENAYPIHRLDKDTTGTIMFAKHPLSKAILDRMLEERKIKRTYVALVDGVMNSSKGMINEPIGRDRHHPTRRRVSKSGQKALTHFEVIKRFSKKNVTLISCQLDTGRTHQIRVHLSHIGYPLAGDRLYGGSTTFTRQALHAKQITFIHPFTLEKIQINAPFLDHPPIFPITGANR